MKKTPSWMIQTDEERRAEKHRRDKARVERKLRAAVDRRKLTATELLADAARAVVGNWSKGDLAAAVRQLDLAVKEYDDANK